MTAKSSSDIVPSETNSNRSLWTERAIDRARARRAAWKSAALLGLALEGERVWSKLLFPTPKLESWKYTNTASIAEGEFGFSKSGPVQLSSGQLGEFIVSDLSPFVIVCVDGIYSKSLSSEHLPDGVEFLSGEDLFSGRHEELAELVGSSGIHQNSEFAALATALLTDVLCLRIPDYKVVPQPIQLLTVTTTAGSGSVQVPRLLVIVGKNSQLSVVHSHVQIGAEGYLTIPIVEAFADEGAFFDYCKIENDSPCAAHISHHIVEQQRGSSATSHLFSFGGKLVRNAANIELKGPNCHSVLNGLSVLADQQHVDNATVIHHVEPGCESRELFKGIYSDRSRGVFSGTIIVESEAQKTNAFQSNQSLLLSTTASIETRPQLKIWADDVKCTHGATVGQIDSEALFYLRSRGIGREDARNFLVHAFAGEVTANLKSPALRDHVSSLISATMEQFRS